MAKPKTWTKVKPANRLPPLTTDDTQVPTTDWHRIKMAEGIEPAPFWAIIWDTSRHDGTFNTAQDKTEAAAHDRAKKFLQMGFVVYSIIDPAGRKSMDEAAITMRFKLEAPAVKAPILPTGDGPLSAHQASRVATP